MEEEIVPITLSILVHEDIHVSEWWIIGVIVERIIAWNFNPKSGETVMSVTEYRQLTGDSSSTDKRIMERLQFLEAFCRNIIKPELQNYDNKK